MGGVGGKLPPQIPQLPPQKNQRRKGGEREGEREGRRGEKKRERERVREGGSDREMQTEITSSTATIIIEIQITLILIHDSTL